jgi:ParB-like chromosome segregation protein Spo0J
MNIEMIDGDRLVEAPWRTTYLLKPDQKVLASSLLDYGWLSPVIVHQKTAMIIDGHERWLIAGDEKKIVRRDKGRVPVVWIDCDEIEAMVMHIRLNRGRGAIQAKKLSTLFKQITRSGRYDKGELKKLFAMSTDEMDLLYDGGLLKTRKLDEHVYSRAWVPIEAPKGAPTPTMSIERPPNADR